MKVNIQNIVSDIQALYVKDKKISSIICTGDSVKTAYTLKDVIPLPDGHPFRQLLGLPGLPYNKIAQIAGKPDCGKSTWGCELVVAAQKAGVQVVYWDSEDKFDGNRLTMLGGKPKDILMIKTNETLKGAELARKYILAIKAQVPEAKILFVWDSVGGSQSRSHAERELDSEKHAQPGQDAKENGSVCKVLVALINKFPDSIAVYLANQTYAKIGFMQKGDATSGGTKIEYHSSFIVMLKRIKVLTKTVKGVITKYGIITRAVASKNHLSQSETSVHQIDFEVTASGSKIASKQGATTDDDSSEDEESE
jgi:RecA/RadA recombinase